MNIGVFTDTFKPCTNGVVDAVWRVCKGFKKEGHNVHLFALSDSDGEEKIEGIYVHKFKGKQFKFYPDFLIRYSLPLRRIFNIINRYRIEVIHSNLNLIMGLSALIVSNRKKIPLITTFHTLVPEFIDCFLGSFDNGGNKPMLLKLLQV
ncbi:MAG TPA: glycosyltransferase, partial [Candidatus Nanoarchaeia archaeon]|nr:glycosyltransferase [Candidatus Nanoarchaeia archaeon]